MHMDEVLYEIFAVQTAILTQTKLKKNIHQYNVLSDREEIAEPPKSE